METAPLCVERELWNDQAPLPARKQPESAESRRVPRDGSLYFSSNHISSRFGLRLRELRRERQLTQVRMSVDYGIDRSYLSDVERGRKSISLPFLEVIALGMRISMSELVKDL